MSRTTRPRPRTYAFPPAMTELMECDGDVQFTVAGIAGRGLLALGHGGRAAIYAAFDAFAVRSWGAGLLDRDTAGGSRLVRTWVKPVADCGRTGGMRHGDRDCEACASPDWAAEYQVRHEHSCWLCAAIKDAPWWLTGLFDDPDAHAGKPGWLPVTVWRDPADVELERSWAAEPAESTAA